MAIRTKAETLDGVINQWAAAREAILGDGDLTKEAKARKVEAEAASYAQRALTLAQSIWGSIPARWADLVGGEAWTALESAKAALQQARDRTGDGYDYQRLQVNQARLPSVMMTHATPNDFLTWYAGADVHMRRAAQMFAPKTLRDKWGIDAGRAVAQLKRDLEDAENGPAVQQAQARLDAVIVDLRDAYVVTRRAANEFDAQRGGALFAGVGSDEGISGVLSRVQRPGPGDPYGWAKVNPYPHLEVLEVSA